MMLNSVTAAAAERARYRLARVGLTLLASLLLCVPSAAQTPLAVPERDPATQLFGPASDYIAPEGLDFRVVDIMSEGVRLHGEVFSLTSLRGEKLPIIIMAHGWGGVAASFRHDAEELAAAGFLVLTFDYRGWGESDHRVILSGVEPTKLPEDRRYTTGVVAVGGYVDPFAQAEDWFNAINWAVADPMVDAERIGLRGSSFSGGLVLYVAAHDERVDALVAQVPGIASRPDPSWRPEPGQPSDDYWSNRHRRAVAMARGEAGYPEPRAKVVGELVGAPMKFQRWWPMEYASQVTQPTLIIVAEDEELVDNEQHGIEAYRRLAGPKQLEVLPGTHYAVYLEQRARAVELAIDWFEEHLN